MTKAERKIIDTAFYSLFNSPIENNERWRKVYENTYIKFKFTPKEKVLPLRYEKRKPIYRICDEIGTTRRTYLYWVNVVLEYALLWVKEFNLL